MTSDVSFLEIENVGAWKFPAFPVLKKNLIESFVDSATILIAVALVNVNKYWLRKTIDR